MNLFKSKTDKIIDNILNHKELRTTFNMTYTELISPEGSIFYFYHKPTASFLDKSNNHLPLNLSNSQVTRLNKWIEENKP